MKYFNVGDSVVPSMTAPLISTGEVTYSASNKAIDASKVDTAILLGLEVTLTNTEVKKAEQVTKKEYDEYVDSMLEDTDKKTPTDVDGK